MQNLTTMNLVDVILQTRAPVGRLIDWVDQAFLLIHLDPASRQDMGGSTAQTDPADPDQSATRLALRRIGVRSATDLLKAFGPGDGQHVSATAWSADQLRARGLDPDQIKTVVRLLADEPGLDPVWNWKAGGAGRSRTPQPASRGASAPPRSVKPRSPVPRTHTRHRTALSSPSI